MRLLFSKKITNLAIGETKAIFYLICTFNVLVTIIIAKSHYVKRK